jgi:hypothetical protein
MSDSQNNVFVKGIIDYPNCYNTSSLFLDIRPSEQADDLLANPVFAHLQLSKPFHIARLDTHKLVPVFFINNSR